MWIRKGPRIGDLLELPADSVYTLQEFKEGTKNQGMVGTRLRSTVWQQHPQRQTVLKQGYIPVTQRIIDGVYNTYSEPDFSWVGLDLLEIEPFKEHMNYIFPDKEDRDYFMRFLAFTVQSPERRALWSPVIIADQGVGKTIIFKIMRRIMGHDNARAITSSKELSEFGTKFNSYMSGKTLICIDEMKSNKWDIMDVIKTMITEEYQTVEHKYGQVGEEQIFANFICFSNNDTPIKITKDDRRFWVHKVEAERKANEYYTMLHDWADTDGPMHLRQFLLDIEIDVKEFMGLPRPSESKDELIIASQDDITDYIHTAIRNKDTDSGCFQCDIVSYKLAYEFIEPLLRPGGYLTNKDRKDIHAVIRKLHFCNGSKGRFKNKIRVPNQHGGKGTEPTMLKAVRNFDKWIAADEDKIREMFKRACNAGRPGFKAQEYPRGVAN